MESRVKKRELKDQFSNYSLTIYGIKFCSTFLKVVMTKNYLLKELA